MSSIFKSALAAALVLGFATTAYAATGQFGNMCSWGLANHKDVATDRSVNTSIRGRAYCFSSEEAKSQLPEEPGCQFGQKRT
jgi:hypothetical protein